MSQVLATELTEKGVSPEAKRHAQLHNHHRAEYMKHRMAYQNAQGGSPQEKFHREKTIHNQKMMQHHAALYHKAINNNDPKQTSRRTGSAPKHKAEVWHTTKRNPTLKVISSAIEVEASEKTNYSALEKHHRAERLKHLEKGGYPSENLPNFNHHQKIAELHQAAAGSYSIADRLTKAGHPAKAREHADFAKKQATEAEHYKRLNKITAAVFNSSKYEWHQWKTGKQNIINDAKGKHHVVLKKGKVFGLRSATSNKNKMRMITPEHGETIVFSLDRDKAEELKKNATPVKRPNMSKAAVSSSMADAYSKAAQSATSPQHMHQMLHEYHKGAAEAHENTANRFIANKELYKGKQHKKLAKYHKDMAHSHNTAITHLTGE